tara:strand:- start:502 stop:1185 length:684 start_codon:yes stop_codon:yes gene_type:complete
MANRPIYLPLTSGKSLVRELSMEFKWHAGLSVSQKQKSIRSLHDAVAAKINSTEILEISSKSENEIGRLLSAFTLKYTLPSGVLCTVECAFQGSKVFRSGGPYTDIYGLNSRAAKKDERLGNSGSLIAFDLESERWPLEPKTCFYDWLYITALHQNIRLREEVLRYGAFSDIEFNPKKSINCQAQSAARYVALWQRGQIERVLSDKDFFLSTYSKSATPQLQGNLFD